MQHFVAINWIIKIKLKDTKVVEKKPLNLKTRKVNNRCTDVISSYLNSERKRKFSTKKMKFESIFNFRLERVVVVVVVVVQNVVGFSNILSD